MRMRGLCRLPDGRDWLWGRLGLSLMGKARLSKSFSVDEWGCVPPCSLALSQTVVGEMETSFLRIYGSMLCLLGLLLSGSLTLQQATVDPHLHQRLPDTQRPFGWLSCGVTAPLSWVLVGTRFCLCPPRVSLSPVLWKFCNRMLLTLKVRFPGDSQSLLLDSQHGKSVASPRIFATVLEFLWCNCSPVCVSPTGQLSGGTNGDLQGDLSHPPRRQDGRHPGPAAGHC